MAKTVLAKHALVRAVGLLTSFFLSLGTIFSLITGLVRARGGTGCYTSTQDCQALAGLFPMAFGTLLLGVALLLLITTLELRERRTGQRRRT